MSELVLRRLVARAGRPALTGGRPDFVAAAATAVPPAAAVDEAPPGGTASAPPVGPSPTRPSDLPDAPPLAPSTRTPDPATGSEQPSVGATEPRPLLGRGPSLPRHQAAPAGEQPASPAPDGPGDPVPHLDRSGPAGGPTEGLRSPVDAEAVRPVEVGVPQATSVPSPSPSALPGIRNSGVELVTGSRAASRPTSTYGAGRSGVLTAPATEPALPPAPPQVTIERIEVITAAPASPAPVSDPFGSLSGPRSGRSRHPGARP